MGATIWNYFAPYDKDTAAVLQKLREQTFRDKKYQRYVPTPKEIDEEESFDREVESMMSDPEKTFFLKPGEGKSDWAERVHGQLERLLREDPDTGSHQDDSQKPIGSIEELLEEQGDSGTHSILDVDHVSEEPEFRAITHMPSEELEQLFGTDKPTRKMVEEKLGDYDLAEHSLISEPWQGIYFTVYRDGKPSELFFMGASGD